MKKAAISLFLSLCMSYCAFGEGSDVPPRPRFLTLGAITTAYSTALTGVFRQELELSDDQRNAIRLLADDFMSSGQRQFLTDKTRFWRSQPWEPKMYFDEGFSKEKGVVRAFNDAVLKSLEEIIADSKKMRRFRQLLTQVLLRRGDFESVVRLNDVKIDFDDFETILRSSAESKTIDEPKSLLVYRGGINLIVKLCLNEDEVSAAAGDEFVHSLRAQEVDVIADPPSFAIARLLLIPEVQDELKLTPRQAVKTAAFSKQISQESTIVLPQLGTREQTSESSQLVDSIDKRVNSKIRSLLNVEQQERIRQLLFQYYIRSQDVDSALRVAGFASKIKNIDDTLWNDVEAESNYARQVSKLKRGKEVLSSVIDERHVDKLCGKYVLSHSVQSLAPGKELKEREMKIRERFAKGLSGVKSKPNRNPRRIIDRESE